MNILIVENDKGFREAWKSVLDDSGYFVRTIGSLANERPEDHSVGCDLALVDRRARDDRDETDISGQEFAVKLCALGTPAVLLTGFRPNDAVIFELLRTGCVAGVADKSVDMGELAKCVDEFKKNHVFPNCVAKFQWRGGEDDSFAREDWEKVRNRVAVLSATPEDFAVLLRSLIPRCAVKVELRPLTPGHGGAALFRARISYGDGPVVEDVAIKYGDRSIIRSEAMRYDRHVGPLPDGVAAHLRWRKETAALGALAYSWVGDSIEDGVCFGPAGGRAGGLNWRRRRSALERLFSVSLDPWYRVYRSGIGRPEKPTTLLEYYTGADGYLATVPFADGPIPNQLPNAIDASGEQWDFGSYGRFGNPISWITRGGGSHLSLNRYCPCHGDLHVKNIFVLPDDSPRLIDFGDTALGHVFRDFAALEASIRLTCCNTADLSIIKSATDCASSVFSLGDHIDYRSVPDGHLHEDVRETLRATMQIRRAALDAVGDHASVMNMKEYLFALALRLLRYASGVADEVSSREEGAERSGRIWHALYAAAAAVQQAEGLR